ncbi:hypothetical protein [Actinophytocola oryzae]|uniref:Excreted virulence factor EspC (Type VII ESX diderm) n=1 Tax=Actinophytocola oryzae TaxID=502181 RepID=A0A4R7VM42_9PSEU|nr:hypothetical protein [Actinophytocola oryzae]TDV50673.1 hypothetical protein CLV71_10613 [Actinophytocola oryzae]
MSFVDDVASGVEAAFKAVERATSAITSGTFTVNRDNVLAAGRIIESQADALHNLWKFSISDMRVDPPGADDVSVRMAAAWNDRLIGDDDSYKNRVKDYFMGLKKLAVQLGDTAKAYGYSEEEIAAAFGTKGA